MASTVGLLMSYVIAAFLPSWEMNFAVSAIALFALTVGMHFYSKYLNRFAIKDSAPIMVMSKNNASGGSTFKLFLASGFFVLLIPATIRCLLGQGAQTLAPIMITESFVGIDTSIGNLLNTLVIVSGLIGTLLVKLVLYPKIIKNEIAGVVFSAAMLLGFTVTFVLAPNLPIFLFSLCGISLFATIGSVFIIYFNASFAKYGKNGTAAGISNAASSFGIVLLNYGVLKISELWGWDTVKYLWLAFAAIYLLCALAVLAINSKFRKKEAKSYN
jgi:hypothetical protein